MSITFDKQTAKVLEGLYQSLDAQNRRKAVLDALQPKTGERILDIGTGLGHLALEMADQTGPAGEIIGIDLNNAMLEVARKRCAKKTWIRFQSGDATNLPVEAESFDAAASVQVYEYIADIDKALSEMYRILKPGGRGVIVASDWKATIWHSSDQARMDKVMKAWEEHCAYSDLPRTLGKQLQQRGFKLQSQSVVLQFNPSLHPDAYSYHAIHFIKSFVPGRGGLTEREVELWAKDLAKLGEKGEYFFCLNQFLFSVIK